MIDFLKLYLVKCDMTRTLSKSKRLRSNVASHFKVAEVQMEALNDPLPPHHPGAATTMPNTPYVALEFSRNNSTPTSSVLLSENFPSKTTSLNKDEVTYPHVTNGTFYKYSLLCD